jgi:hypothetical protein
MRKTMASLQRDRSDLQSALESIKADTEKKTKVLKRFGSSPVQGTDNATAYDTSPEGEDALVSRDPTGVTPADYQTTAENADEQLLQDHSYRLKAETDLAADDLEVLKQNFAHAQRQIATLRNSLQKEKEMRLDQKRKLVLAQKKPESGSETEEEEFEDISQISLPRERIKGRMRSSKVHVGAIKHQISLAHRLGMQTPEQAKWVEEDSSFDPDIEDESSLSSAPQLRSSETTSPREGSVELDPAFVHTLRRDSTIDLSKGPPAQVRPRYLPSNPSRPSSVVAAPAPLALELGFESPSQCTGVSSLVVTYHDAGCQASLGARGWCYLSYPAHRYTNNA